MKTFDYDELKAAATELRRMFHVYREAGFSEDQALTIILHILSGPGEGK